MRAPCESGLQSSRQESWTENNSRSAAVLALFSHPDRKMSLVLLADE